MATGNDRFGSARPVNLPLRVAVLIAIGATVCGLIGAALLLAVGSVHG
jgi:hypothetical protein